MSQKLNSLPPIISQAIDSINDPSTPEHIKFNHIKNLENVVEQCGIVIKRYYNKQKVGKK